MENKIELFVNESTHFDGNLPIFFNILGNQNIEEY